MASIEYGLRSSMQPTLEFPTALSDPTRRGILERLGRRDASVSELARLFGMSLTGIQKHVSVLEAAGLVTTEKVGRVRRCRSGPRRLEEETAWMERFRQGGQS